MPTPNPAALDFLLTRRSRPAKTLTTPVPDRAALAPILQAGGRSPDHKKLEPWRFAVLERPALQRIAGAVRDYGATTGIDPAKIDKGVRQFEDGHLAIMVVIRPVETPDVPEIELTLSAGAVCLQVLNAALASGWGANWLTGWMVHDPAFATAHLGLSAGERVAGLIFLGTETAAPPERPRPAIIAPW